MNSHRQRRAFCFSGVIYCMVAGSPAVGADAILLPLPQAPDGLESGVSPALHDHPLGESASLFSTWEGPAASPPAGARPPSAGDTGLTTQRRRWRSVASPGGHPYLFGMPGDAARLSLGLQSDIFYTDNIEYDCNNRAVGAAILEISPVVRLDVGDPADGSSVASRPSKYHGGFLWVPTLHHTIEDGTTEYVHHFFSEIERMTEITRISLRLDYDERILASSDDASPEETFTQLEASTLFEYHFTPKTKLGTKATYRDIVVEDDFSNRRLFLGEAILEWAATAKTSLGVGTEIGHIRFEEEDAGTQDYQQALVIFRWRPTQKLALYSRAGAEWREFEGGSTPRDTRLTPVVAASLQWQMQEKTRVSARASVRNEPSIVEEGALYQEIRFATELEQDLSAHWYASAEVMIVERDYDSGHREIEPGAALAIGFREHPERSQSHLNVELYVQWRERQRSDVAQVADRTQIGLRVTKFF